MRCLQMLPSCTQGHKDEGPHWGRARRRPRAVSADSTSSPRASSCQSSSLQTQGRGAGPGRSACRVGEAPSASSGYTDVPAVPLRCPWPASLDGAETGWPRARRAQGSFLRLAWGRGVGRKLEGPRRSKDGLCLGPCGVLRWLPGEPPNPCCSGGMAWPAASALPTLPF